MALDVLPADGKLPDTLPGKPDKELAAAWAREYGGKVDFYVTNSTGEALAGYVECAAPTVNYGGRKYYGVPQVRTLDDEKRQDAFLKSLEPKETEQPNWKWGDDLTETQSQEAKILRPPAEDVPLQPDFGWTPNPEDLDVDIKTRPAVPGGDKVQLTPPNFGWDAGNGDQPSRQPADILRPPAEEPVLQPDFGWTPNPEDI